MPRIKKEPGINKATKNPGITIEPVTNFKGIINYRDFNDLVKKAFGTGYDYLGSECLKPVYATYLIKPAREFGITQKDIQIKLLEFTELHRYASPSIILDGLCMGGWLDYGVYAIRVD